MRSPFQFMSRKRAAQAALALASIALLAAGLCSCGRTERRLSGDDARGHLIRLADEAAQKGEWNEAVDLYERALRHRPDMAAAHRRLAPILQEYKKDVVGALYHYDRYLQLAPQALDRDDVIAAADTCRQYIAASTGGDTSELVYAINGKDETIRQLQRELANVQESLRIAKAKLDAASTASAPPPRLPSEGRQAAALPAPVPAPARPATPPANPGTYVVQPGDTLSKIAQRHHTTTETLSAMNQLSNPNALRVGMTLRLPKAATP